MALFKQVTMQDIADACGLSRNTVSKIFNGRGAVPEATRTFVLEKAKEMGYLQIKDLGYSSPAEEKETISRPDSATVRNIALLTHSKPSLHNFGSQFITNFTDQICRFGCNLKIFEITDADYARKTLPSHFVPKEVSGIITLELFDRDYTQMICNLGIPVLLVDSYCAVNCRIFTCICRFFRMADILPDKC